MMRIRKAWGLGAAALLLGVAPLLPSSWGPGLLAPAPALAQKPAALSPSDKATGAKVREQILREFGGEITGPLADYVRSVGTRVAMVAAPGSMPSDWTITVLDSPIPNAMATPGGYLYITRGLLALMNDEAELASVLGHEAGHVAARHSAKSQRRATFATIGAIAATVLTGSDLVGMGAQVLGAGVLGQYSQKQEYEADTLGLRYMAAIGYDPYATADMLAALNRASIVEKGTAAERNRGSSFFATHPLTDARIARARKLAADTGVAPGTQKRNAEPFLIVLDGMAWGDSPSQGFTRGSSFRHPRVGLAFDAPTGFKLQNSSAAVRGQGPDGSQFVFSGAQIPPGRSLDDIARDAWRQLAGGVPANTQGNRLQVNGFDTLDTSARVSARQGQSDVGVTVYRWSNDSAFILVTQAPAGRLAAMESLVRSFRRMTPEEARNVGAGQKVKVVTVRQGDTVDSLARQMAFTDNQVMRFLALNGMEYRPLKPGERVKLIVNG
jgi:predicted Zn-dependent protease